MQVNNKGKVEFEGISVSKAQVRLGSNEEMSSKKVHGNNVLV